MTDKDTFMREAADFLSLYYAETDKAEAELGRRMEAVHTEIARTGTYVHTFEELEYGAKVAWRNSNRCIGRLFWPSLRVFDARDARTEEEMAERLRHHLRFGLNGGKVKPCLTVFRPASAAEEEVRIWNSQLVRYAGYQTEKGVIGDPLSVPFTDICRSLGWQGEGTPFDILPMVIRIGDRLPRWFELTRRDVMEVHIRHPAFAWFTELNLRWYAMPFIADMLLEIGGVKYTAAPFNAWYMETEIGARNLADPDRYNMLPRIGERLGLDISTNVSLWRDKALVELNTAVLHSYKTAGVSMVDHHSAADQFRRFEEREKGCGRKVTGDWRWLIPPMSPATTHMFHREYDNTIVKPNYFFQESPY